MYFSAQVMWGPHENKGNVIGNLRYIRTCSEVWRQYSCYKFKMLIYGYIGLMEFNLLKAS